MPAPLTVHVQRITTATTVPPPVQLKTWVAAVRTALTRAAQHIELTIRIVDYPESATLNQRYRGRDGATNVLSFPSTAPRDLLPVTLLGDLVICAPLIAQEAQEQQKTLEAHWAHIVIHGVLHLYGFDHHHDAAAIEMEQLETRILATLGFASPYETDWI